MIDGVVQLDEGAAALNDGMLQFNEEGIEKLTEVFEGDVGSLLDKMNEMLDASRKYNNFSGISDEMGGAGEIYFCNGINKRKPAPGNKPVLKRRWKELTRKISCDKVKLSSLYKDTNARVQRG